MGGLCCLRCLKDNDLLTPAFAENVKDCYLFSAKIIVLSDSSLLVGIDLGNVASRSLRGRLPAGMANQQEEAIESTESL